jgi:hypothetical protein
MTEGFVVIPSTMPCASQYVMSSSAALSKKSCIRPPFQDRRNGFHNPVRLDIRTIWTAREITEADPGGAAPRCSTCSDIGSHIANEPARSGFNAEVTRCKEKQPWTRFAVGAIRA